MQFESEGPLGSWFENVSIFVVFVVWGLLFSDIV